MFELIPAISISVIGISERYSLNKNEIFKVFFSTGVKIKMAAVTEVLDKLRPCLNSSQQSVSVWWKFQSDTLKNVECIVLTTKHQIEKNQGHRGHTC